MFVSNAHAASSPGPCTETTSYSPTSLSFPLGTQPAYISQPPLQLGIECNAGLADGTWTRVTWATFRPDLKHRHKNLHFSEFFHHPAGSRWF